jgi:Ice-binding-like
MGQASPGSEAAAPAITDWTYHHVIFSKPATAEQARRVEQDPRYWQQIRRQLPAAPAPEARPVLAPEFRTHTHTHGASNNSGLWSEDLGTGATMGALNYPAKYSLTTTTASCSSDFVVFPTGLAGSSTQASIIAYSNLYSGCTALNLGTAANFALLASSTITSTGDSVVTGGNIGISPGTSLTGFPPGVLTAPAVEHLGDAVAAQAQADANTAYTYYQGLTGATSIASVLDGQTFAPGVYNSSTLSLGAGKTVTLNGSGTYIFQIGTTLTLAGTVVLSGGATAGNVIWLVGSSATINAGAVAIGDIVALASITLDSGASVTGRTIALNGAVTMIDNPVTTLDTVPSVYWAYNTSGGTIQNSPVFSLDGTQIAFMQLNTTGSATLVLLKWAASTTESVDHPDLPGTHGNYATCNHPPCTAELNLNDAGVFPIDTNSSIFVDYVSDTAFVGDDSGYLHKFNPVFNSTSTNPPAEVESGGWPVKVNAAAPTALTSPVYDSVSGNVYVTDKGGFLYSVDSSTAAVTVSGQLDFSNVFDGGPGIVEGPILDFTSELLYVFATSDGSAGTGPCPGDCAAVYQLATGFIAGETGSEAVVGDSSVEPAAPSPMYIGTFDSTYKNSANATGNLYVCGNTGGTPTIYQVAIGAGVLGTVNAGPALSASTTPCSSVTDVLNPNASGGATEWIFASADTGGVSTACAAGGCILNFKDTPWLPLTVYTVGQEVVDSNFHTEFVGTPGTSSAGPVFWDIAAGGSTTDGTVHWLDMGRVSANPLASWAGSHPYPKGAKILDGNNNIELATTGGTSGTSVTFNPTVGGTTTDGTVTWTNVGPSPTAALAVTGGASGIIVDNTVATGTQAGASQVYFSTLGNQACTGGGTGGCAVQASQSALK